MFDESNMINARDYKFMGPNRAITRYIRVGKYLKGIKWGWIESGNQLDPSLCLTTGIRIDGGNFGTVYTQDLGRVHVCYYVAFKTRINPA